MQSFPDQLSRETPELSEAGGLKQPLYITHNMSSSKIRTDFNTSMMSPMRSPVKSPNLISMGSNTRNRHSSIKNQLSKDLIGVINDQSEDESDSFHTNQV